MRVLLIEDSARLSGAVATGLRGEGLAVDVAHDGAAGLHLARHGSYDAILLDLMLPVLDGLGVLRGLRAEGDETPVLILTARDQSADIVAGLEAGADDYMTKPFGWEELQARLRALLRRRYPYGAPLRRVGDLELDPRARALRVGGERLSLSRREYAVLEYLVCRGGETARREEIEAAVYETTEQPAREGVTTVVCRLRKRLRALDGAPRIRTIRGLGYRIDTEQLMRRARFMSDPG